jgi:hypothetical protein
MGTLGKVALLALLVVYSLIGFTILSPFVSLLTKNPIIPTIGIYISFTLVLVAFFAFQFSGVSWKGIFSHLTDEEARRTWLLLHSFFTFSVGKVYPVVTFIASVAPLYLGSSESAFSTNLMLTWALFLFSIIGLWGLHLWIGMGYRWLCKGTSIGIRSFSGAALYYLEKKDQKGTKYLQTALLLLRDFLAYEELKLEELNNTLKAVRCFLRLESEIPYERLQIVALELTRFPSVERLPLVLSQFTRNPKVEWTGSLAVTEKTKRTTLEVVVVIATVLSGLTFLPETARNALLATLQSVGTLENIQIIIGGFLVIVTGYIISLIGAYYLDPLDAGKFRRETEKGRQKENRSNDTLK